MYVSIIFDWWTNWVLFSSLTPIPWIPKPQSVSEIQFYTNISMYFSWLPMYMEVRVKVRGAVFVKILPWYSHSEVQATKKKKTLEFNRAKKAILYLKGSCNSAFHFSRRLLLIDNHCWKFSRENLLYMAHAKKCSVNIPWLNKGTDNWSVIVNFTCAKLCISL